MPALLERIELDDDAQGRVALYGGHPPLPLPTPPHVGIGDQPAPRWLTRLIEGWEGALALGVILVILFVIGMRVTH